MCDFLIGLGEDVISTSRVLQANATPRLFQKTEIIDSCFHLMTVIKRFLELKRSRLLDPQMQ